MSGETGLTVLTYHSIGPETTPLATSPERFTSTMARLLESGWRAVGLNEWVTAGRPGLSRTFAVAFDDGLASIIPAIEVLERLHIPATVFLVTARVGLDNGWPGQPRWVPRERLLDWQEVESLAHRGVSFASHGATHSPFDRLDSATLRDELASSRRTVEERTGVACPLIAYPYGGVSRRIANETSRLYAAAFGTRLGSCKGGSHPYLLPRLDAFYLRDQSVLAALVNGHLDGWMSRQDVLRGVRRTVGSVLDRIGRAA